MFERPAPALAGPQSMGPPFQLWIDAVQMLSVAVLTACLGAVGSAPPTEAAPLDSTRTDKYWIVLADRSPRVSSSADTSWTRPVAPAYLGRLRARGVQPLVRSRWLHAVSARLSPDKRASVAALPFVEETRPVASLRPQGRSYKADPDHPPLEVGAAEGPLSRINALPPLARGLSGHGVHVGFLDANYAGLRHPVFSRLRMNNQLGGLRTFTTGQQGGNHGAGVVSVAAGYEPGSLVGPAYGATVWGATTEFTQFERNVEEDHFVAGLEWLTRRGVDVVNVSIGYTRFDDGQRSYSTDDLDGDTALTTRAVDRAAQQGVTVVVSAGNSGCAAPDDCWFYVNTPADADSAIAVGAIAPDSSVASFSARGPTPDGRRKPDVVVQGQEVPAAWENGGYARVGGTSFASPQVTGIVAQMLQVNPALGPMQVRRLLRRTASQAHAPDSTRGWGIVNAEAAVRHAEWKARRSPPHTLQGSAPHSPPNAHALVLPVSAPAQTATLQATLRTPLGKPVRHIERVGHPGPNRLVLDVDGLAPGRYRYVVTTDQGHEATGSVTISK
ncbi:MAG: S8 family serine peptidase [Salinibacter sp.]|uniref:S8 family serine peptidase n=1 Tax=Salinibacter sp. TaxID=2065818 RepID=UPI002FC356A3